jgi:hypothetical protein
MNNFAQKGWVKPMSSDEVITKICVCGLFGGRDVGTIRTTNIIIPAPKHPITTQSVDLKGPDIEPLKKCCFEGEPAIFKANEPLDHRFGPFNGMVEMVIRDIGIRNDGNPEVVPHFRNGEWWLDAWWPKTPGTQAPGMELYGHWSTNFFIGWFEAKYLILESLEDLFTLPNFNFRWRKDVAGVMKAKTIELKKANEMHVYNRGTPGHLSTVRPQTFVRPLILSSNDSIPYFHLISTDESEDSYLVQLDEVIQNPDIVVEWMELKD